MQDHIRYLMSRFQYSEQLRETAVFRILFSREEVNQMMEDADSLVNSTRYEASTKAGYGSSQAAQRGIGTDSTASQSVDPDAQHHN